MYKLHQAKLMVLDLSGTTMDKFSRAPILMLQEACQKFGLTFMEREISKDMGLPKIEHIRRLIGNKDPKLVLSIYNYMTQLAPQILEKHSYPIPEALEGIKLLRRNGWLITATTGFPQSLGSVAVKCAGWKGLKFDNVVYSDEIINPRPNANGIYELCRRLKIGRDSVIIKCGDTEHDILEGINANATYVFGVDKYSLTTSRKLTQSGADNVYPTVYEMAKFLDKRSRNRS